MLDSLLYIISFFIILYFIYIWYKNILDLKKDIKQQKINKQINKSLLVESIDNKEKFINNNEVLNNTNEANMILNSANKYKRFMNVNTYYNLDNNVNGIADTEHIYNVSEEHKSNNKKNYINLQKDENSIRLANINNFNNSDINTDYFYYKLKQENNKSKKFNPDINNCRKKLLYNKKNNDLIFNNVSLIPITNNERKKLLERMLEGFLYPQKRINLNNESSRLFELKKKNDKELLSPEEFEEKYKWLSKLEQRINEQKIRKTKPYLLSDSNIQNSNISSYDKNNFRLIFQQLFNTIIKINNIKNEYNSVLDDDNKKESNKIIYETEIKELEQQYKNYKNKINKLLTTYNQIDNKTLNDNINNLLKIDLLLVELQSIETQYDNLKQNKTILELDNLSKKVELDKLQNSYTEKLNTLNILLNINNKNNILDYANIKIFLEEKEVRTKTDIMTDYNPYIFNKQRPWQETQFISTF